MGGRAAKAGRRGEGGGAPRIGARPNRRGGKGSGVVTAKVSSYQLERIAAWDGAASDGGEGRARSKLRGSVGSSASARVRGAGPAESSSGANFGSAAGGEEMAGAGRIRAPERSAEGFPTSTNGRSPRQAPRLFSDDAAGAPGARQFSTLFGAEPPRISVFSALGAKLSPAPGSKPRFPRRYRLGVVAAAPRPAGDCEHFREI